MCSGRREKNYMTFGIRKKKRYAQIQFFFPKTELSYSFFSEAYSFFSRGLILFFFLFRVLIQFFFPLNISKFCLVFKFFILLFLEFLFLGYPNYSEFHKNLCTGIFFSSKSICGVGFLHRARVRVVLACENDKNIKNKFFALKHDFMV